jgi:hypothetical protein
MQNRPTKFRPRVPCAARPLGRRDERSLYGAYLRALAITAAASTAEHHIILAIAFAHQLEIPLPQFEFALRKFKRQRAIAR